MRLRSTRRPPTRASYFIRSRLTSFVNHRYAPLTDECLVFSAVVGDAPPADRLVALTAQARGAVDARGTRLLALNRIAVRLRCDCGAIAVRLRWDCGGIAVGLRWDCGGLHETHAFAVFRCLRTPRTRRLRRRLHDTASSLPRRQASGEANAVVWVWEADLDDSGTPPLTNAPWARERYAEIWGDMRRSGEIWGDMGRPRGRAREKGAARGEPVRRGRVP